MRSLLCLASLTLEPDASTSLCRDNIRRSENKLANRQLLLEVIGKLSALRCVRVQRRLVGGSPLTVLVLPSDRFETVTDRFLTELERGVKLGLNTTGTTASKADREAEARLETVVRAMDTIQLRVSPSPIDGRESEKAHRLRA